MVTVSERRSTAVTRLISPGLKEQLETQLILAGGRIRTLGRSGLKPHSHLAVGGGRVVACGGAEIMSLRGPRTRVVRLAGATVLPGFNDAHAHVVYYGLTRFGADLGGTRSVDEIARRLEENARPPKPRPGRPGTGRPAS